MTVLNEPAWMTNLIHEVSAWSGISTCEHRYGGIEFRLGHREIGHVHDFGVVDIPFTVAIRDALVRAGLARPHRWLPNSGWTAIPVINDADAATKLLRLSFVKTVLKSRDPAAVKKAGLELQTIDLSKEVLDLVRG